jgi:hypothetical protein
MAYPNMFNIRHSGLIILNSPDIIPAVFRCMCLGSYHPNPYLRIYDPVAAVDLQVLLFLN